MPAASPLFPRPPMQLKNAEAISVTYLTDTEAALDVLPECLELREPATSTLSLFYVPNSSIGSYYEALWLINATFEGKPIRYDVLSILTNDQAMTFGREVLGVAKKLGYVHLEHRPEGVFGWAERPLGQRLVSVGIALEEQMDVSQAAGPPESACSLRILHHPSPEGGQGEIAIELLEAPSTWQLLEQWKGTGNIAFGSSPTDDWEILPVKEVVGAFYSKYDIQIPVPRLLARM
jgi:acetoacetate decarboxylase